MALRVAAALSRELRVLHCRIRCAQVERSTAAIFFAGSVPRFAGAPNDFEGIS